MKCARTSKSCSPSGGARSRPPTGKGCNVIGEHRAVSLQRPMPAQQVHQPRLGAALGGVDGFGGVIPRAPQLGFAAPDRATLLIVRRPWCVALGHDDDAGRYGTTLSTGPERMILMCSASLASAAPFSLIYANRS